MPRASPLRWANPSVDQAEQQWHEWLQDRAEPLALLRSSPTLTAESLVTCPGLCKHVGLRLRWEQERAISADTYMGRARATGRPVVPGGADVTLNPVRSSINPRESLLVVLLCHLPWEELGESSRAEECNAATKDQAP